MAEEREGREEMERVAACGTAVWPVDYDAETSGGPSPATSFGQCARLEGRKGLRVAPAGRGKVERGARRDGGGDTRPSLSFGFVRFAPAPRVEREPRVSAGPEYEKDRDSRSDEEGRRDATRTRRLTRVERERRRVEQRWVKGEKKREGKACTSGGRGGRRGQERSAVRERRNMR